jgi:hypothetical protein
VTQALRTLIRSLAETLPAKPRAKLYSKASPKDDLPLTAKEAELAFNAGRR